jgi:hypothetical protein
MKQKILLAVMALALLPLWSCSDDYLDVNYDPGALETVPEGKVLLPTAEMAVANSLMGWDFGFGGGFWVQYWTQNYTSSQFKTLCEYQPQQFSTTYTSLMTRGLNNLKRIQTLYADTADSKNLGYYYVAEALSVFTWQIVTDVWGDIPYLEALKANDGLMHPKFDKQEDIYKDLIARADNLLSIDISETSIDGGYDFFFKGDLSAWEEFVAALKLKLMLRLSETPGYNNAEVFDFFAESPFYFEVSAKISGSVWNDSDEGKRHPMREFDEKGAEYVSGDVRGCKSFIDYLETNGDPRLGKLFSGTKSAFFGDFDSKDDSDGNGTPDDKETYCTPTFAPDMDLFIMSQWEVYFNIAEVCARAGEMDYAREYYEYGVSESLQQHGIDDESIIEQGGYAEWTATTTEQAIQQIAMQRWVAYCNYQHIEAFLERNRSKYPAVDDIDIATNRPYAYFNFPIGKLTISVKGRGLLNGNLPASPIYPEAVITRNNNALPQKPDVGQKVWWNQKTGK